MWYRNSNKTLYVPKTELDIYKRGSNNTIVAFHYPDAANVCYPRDEIFEIEVDERYIENSRVAHDASMDGEHGPLSYSSRCLVKTDGDIKPVDRKPTHLDYKDAQRIASTLNTVSKLLENAGDDLFRSNRVAETSWSDYIEAIVNLQEPPKVPQSYYQQKLANGNSNLRNCLGTLGHVMIELQAHKHSHPSLPQLIWSLEKSMEQLATADDHNNSIALRGKFVVYASENIAEIAHAIRRISHH